ncbi:ImmA/IrrE family metallo-endopeptidase [Desulfovibrio cuneatus]|uniref:ImmA/IrrE family metallo-endopeptidase n=1 Tax=Desulfovibrio cuneatus TaxID=159728 RepID=UPI0003F7CFC2|nr:ImmA/IrrE family metallo-endopeptidase [Desulfovibrio cuneatus]
MATAKALWVLETLGVSGPPTTALHAIADHEGIRYLYRNLPNDPGLSGQLLFKGDKKGIIVNTHNGNPGKHAFTFAHELGHYFLEHTPSFTKDGNTGFWCSTDDIKHNYKKQEAEANRFAVALLMPEHLFRPLMAGSVLDFTLINSLAREFQVSKHACANRALDFVREPYAVILSNRNTITTHKSSRAALGFLRTITHIPQGTAAHNTIVNKRNQESFAACEPEKWLTRSVPGCVVYEWTRGNFMREVAMTILRW